jgi:hypothetical protein
MGIKGRFLSHKICDNLGNRGRRSNSRGTPFGGYPVPGVLGEEDVERLESSKGTERM